eukprot:14856199-Alexandrium_andersonii.AAC.1
MAFIFPPRSGGEIVDRRCVHYAGPGWPERTYETEVQLHCVFCFGPDSPVQMGMVATGAEQ